MGDMEQYELRMLAKDREMEQAEEEHELECWAEEERMANEDWHDDCIIYGEPDYDDSFISADELDELDRTADVDAYEADKRARIAEANEY